MNIHITENNCRDPEVRVLDTKLPYFYSKVRSIFDNEPSSVNVILVGNKEDFCSYKGEETEEGAFISGDTIYIYEPNLFGSSTKIERKYFYKTLYQELVYLFYKTNRKIGS